MDSQRVGHDLAAEQQQQMKEKFHFELNSMSLFAGPRDTSLARLYSEEWTFLFSTQVGANKAGLKMYNMDVLKASLLDSVQFSSVQSLRIPA